MLHQTSDDLDCLVCPTGDVARTLPVELEMESPCGQGHFGSSQGDD